jgi:hypothetical protein
MRGPAAKAEINGRRSTIDLPDGRRRLYRSVLRPAWPRKIGFFY